MKERWILVCVFALGLLLALAVGLSQAQGPEPPEGEVQPQGETGVTADVSAVIPIQGRLTDASGNPLNGTYSIRFRLCDAASGGSVVCEDTNSVEVTSGLFNSEIGGSCDSSDIDGRQLYLGIKVGTDGEMVPRQAIYPVPYAFSLRPGAVISETTSYVGLNRYVSILPFTYKYGVYAKASGAISNYGVAGYSEGNYGAGVFGSTDSSLGYGGHFLNTAVGGAGLYAKGGEGTAADLVLGGEGSGGNDDDGRIFSDPAYDSSDIYLHSNDAIVLDLDNDNDEDGDLEVRNGSNETLLKVSENGCVNMGINAGIATPISIGDRYRENAIIAWAYVVSDGTAAWDFGVASVTRAGTGDYIVEIDATTAGITSFAPMAIAEVEAAPDSAGEVRIVYVNHTAPSVFHVYITNGNWDLVNNPFVFMVTGR